VKKSLIYAVLWCAPVSCLWGQPVPTNAAEAKSGSVELKADDDAEKKAAEWTAALHLEDAEKVARVQNVIATHLKHVRNWNQEHSYTNVPAGINPVTGQPLSVLDRQVIADSAMPKSVHENLMTGLRKDLSEEQVGAVLDKYTIGKVAFTMNGYQAIVPDLTQEEAATIQGFLQQAREQAVDYKSIKEISVVFEIYKTKSEQYLNSHGRNWHELYAAFVKAAQAKKAGTHPPAAKPAPAP